MAPRRRIAHGIAESGYRKVTIDNQELVVRSNFEDNAIVGVECALGKAYSLVLKLLLIVVSEASPVPYVLIPCTQQPGVQSAFAISIACSSGPVNLRPVTKEWTCSSIQVAFHAEVPHSLFFREGGVERVLVDAGTMQRS